jgi:photosystem II stability/assembly factor-like uncharacterized protein
MLTALAMTLAYTAVLGQPAQEPPKKVTVKVVAGGESTKPAAQCRQMLIGPGVNQPDPFPGYDGFVGWEAPARLKDGTWLMTFSAGYWHASPPTPLRLDKKCLAEWSGLGMRTDIDAPTGGRAMIMRSHDQGVTWTKPRTLFDTPADDRHPNCVQLPDGTILCTFFAMPGWGDFEKERDLNTHVVIVRSRDGGKTWARTPPLPSPFIGEAADGPMIVLNDGSVLLVTYGVVKMGVPEQDAFFRSIDSGKTWKLLSVVKSDHEMSEPSVAQLPSGRLVMMTRPEGDICWSDDVGKTWTKPVSFGVRLYEPGLIALKDGTLLCIHGSYGAGGLRAIFSTDGGATWIAPAPNYGFAVDSTVYGYGKGIELPDGSVYIVYINTGGHTTKDAQTEAIWGVRLKVRPDHSGIDILPAPGVGK